jgi:lipopolysaccharide biosynthesis glycosyltransferase
MRKICITISTDAQGFSKNATLIASIVRRTQRDVQVRCYTRGFSQRSFAIRNLTVDFVRAEEEVTGRFPGHVPIAVFDRLRVMRDEPEWDRCLVLDHDMVCLSDLGEYFDEDFEGNLLMGRLFGPGNTLGLQMKGRGGLPSELAHAAEYPYFFMGPMMNLALMRQENTWEKLLECHALMGQEEQLALTAATGGRTKGVDRKWNQVPQWDNKDGNEITLEGIIHWTGGGKPWHRATKVWRPEIWEAERCNWESLREGEWDKPVAEDFGGTGARAAQGLLRRGWRVISHGNDALWDKPWQDLVRGAADQSVLMRRFGPAMPCEEIIKVLTEAADDVPVILEGYRREEEIRRIAGNRYNASMRWLTKEWPPGGPAPEVLDKQAGIAAQSLHPGEEICLFVASAKELRQLAVAMPLTRKEDDSWSLHQAACGWLRTSLPELLPASAGKKRRILELGTGRSTEVLAEQFPDAEIVTLEHDVTWYHRHEETLAPFPHVTCLLAPLDAGLRWYDLSEVPAGPYDFLLVDGPPRTCGGKNRDAAKCILPWLAEDAIILLDDTDAAMVSSWAQMGYAILHQDESFAVLKRTRACESLPTERHESLAALAAKTYVISLPERNDRREALQANWGEAALSIHWIDGIRCAAEDISWSEMKGMEAYGDAAKLRGDYVLGAVGCKRAGIAALRAFLASGATTALICQDDCHWVDQADEQIARALQEVPADWDLLYFSATQRSPYIPVSPFWMKLTGGRLCTAIVWKRETAMRLLPALEVCDCEWDVFMEREHSKLNAYAMRPMPAYQAASFSDIVRRQTQVANR